MTGTSAVMASLYAKGQLGPSHTFKHASIVGSEFTGKLLEEREILIAQDIGAAEELKKGSKVKAVVAEISGRAWITQYASVVCDPTDPFPHGFTVGDIW